MLPRSLDNGSSSGSSSSGNTDDVSLLSGFSDEASLWDFGFTDEVDCSTAEDCFIEGESHGSSSVSLECYPFALKRTPYGFTDDFFYFQSHLNDALDAISVDSDPPTVAGHCNMVVRDVFADSSDSSLDSSSGDSVYAAGGILRDLKKPPPRWFPLLRPSFGLYYVIHPPQTPLSHGAHPVPFDSEALQPFLM